MLTSEIGVNGSALSSVSIRLVEEVESGVNMFSPDFNF